MTMAKWAINSNVNIYIYCIVIDCCGRDDVCILCALCTHSMTDVCSVCIRQHGFAKLGAAAIRYLSQKGVICQSDQLATVQYQSSDLLLIQHTHTPKIIPTPASKFVPKDFSIVSSGHSSNTREHHYLASKQQLFYICFVKKNKKYRRRLFLWWATACPHTHSTISSHKNIMYVGSSWPV